MEMRHLGIFLTRMRPSFDQCWIFKAESRCNNTETSKPGRGMWCRGVRSLCTSFGRACEAKRWIVETGERPGEVKADGQFATCNVVTDENIRVYLVEASHKEVEESALVGHRLKLDLHPGARRAHMNEHDRRLISVRVTYEAPAEARASHAARST